jgi:hypothetical protein
VRIIPYDSIPLPRIRRIPGGASEVTTTAVITSASSWVLSSTYQDLS